MTTYEYNAERAKAYRKLAAETSDEYLKKFYYNAAFGHELRNQCMSIEQAMQEHKC